MTRIIDELMDIKKDAHAGPVGKRVSSFVLYDVLQRCAMVVERISKNPGERLEVESLIKERPRGNRNRSYVESGSDEFVLVCRYVFPSTESADKERSNASRYAAALRQMTLEGIKSDEVAHKLKTEGGINRFYLTRPVERKTVITKTLYLDRSIEVPKTGQFMLVLQRLEDGRIEVLSKGE
jgi:hypothetical protein